MYGHQVALKSLIPRMQIHPIYVFSNITYSLYSKSVVLSLFQHYIYLECSKGVQIKFYERYQRTIKIQVW